MLKEVTTIILIPVEITKPQRPILNNENKVSKTILVIEPNRLAIKFLLESPIASRLLESGA